ncbi:MAG: DUF1513 domain-containing protein [Rhizobiaceae bacterium]
MTPSLIDRRDFLKAAGIGFVAALAPRGGEALAAADAVFATAYQRRDGQYGVAVLSEDGKPIYSTPLPERGHDITFDPVSRRSVVFARQPGTFMVVFDHSGEIAPVTIPSIAGRHFFGHGVFSPDGALLYATENDFDNAAGMVGVYDARDGFRRLGEFPTHGIGPHELVLLPDGETLGIANGGIETHPDFGRAELNLSTMKPSFALVDRGTGDLRELHELPAALHQLSIRHMDIAADGAVWFGCQHRGPAGERPPLVGVARRGEDLRLIDIADDALADLRNYVGSVAANRDANIVAVSSPQGNAFLTFDATTGEVLARQSLQEVCGLAADAAGFLATTGTGLLHRPDGSDRSEPDYVWDNHLLRIS